MLEMKDDTLLYYNVFGVAVISKDSIIVQLNIYKDGKIKGRALKKELENPLPNVSVAFMIPFGAWVEENQIDFTPGRLEEYDIEAYETNKEIIDETIKSALGLIKGAVTS